MLVTFRKVQSITFKYKSLNLYYLHEVSFTIQASNYVIAEISGMKYLFM